MKILHVNKNIIDVFWGRDGWEPHTRLYVQRTGSTIILSHMTGKKLPTIIKSNVARLLGAS